MIDIVNLTLREGSLYCVGQFTILTQTNDYLISYNHFTILVTILILYNYQYSKVISKPVIKLRTNIQ